MIAGQYKKSPGNITYTFSRSAHQEIWFNLGNDGPAPVAFMNDGHMRVDVEGWALIDKQWSEGRLNEIGLKLKDSRLPPAAAGGVVLGGVVGGDKPATSGGNKPGTQGNSGTGDVDVKKAENFIKEANEADGLSKDIEKKLKKGEGGRVDTGKLETKTTHLESDGATLAKQFQAHPDFADLYGGKAEQFYANVRGKYGKVRASVSGLIQLALNVSDAYELVENVRFILGAKSFSEAFDRAISVGENYAKGAAELAVLRFVTRSGPVAIGLSIVLGTKDQDTPKERRQRSFHIDVANLVNQYRPGSIIILGSHYDQGIKYADSQGERLFKEALRQAIDKRIDYVSKGAHELGIKDGMTGTVVKRTFEVSKADEEDLEIDERFLELAYYGGTQEGEHKSRTAIKRARQEGLKDGKKGGPPNFKTIEEWVELKELKSRGIDTRISNDQHYKYQVLYNKYASSYDDGYQEGLKLAKTKVIAKLVIKPDSLKMGLGTGQLLSAELLFSDKSTQDVTSDVKWKSTDERVVKVGNTEGSVYVQTVGKGKADILATYQGTFGSAEGKVAAIVEPPRVHISPVNPTMKVGAKDHFWAVLEGVLTTLEPDQVLWESEDPKRATVDAKGNVTIMAPGPPVKITAKLKNSDTPFVGVTIITIENKVVKLELSPKEVTSENYATRVVQAKLIYADGTNSWIGPQAKWTSQDPKVVEMSSLSAQQFTNMKGVGKSKITAQFKFAGKTYEDSMTITVTPPKLRITPDKGAYKVGDKVQFLASTEFASKLTRKSVTWDAFPMGSVMIDGEGNAEMRQEGDAEVTVSDRHSSSRATAILKIGPRA